MTGLERAGGTLRALPPETCKVLERVEVRRARACSNPCVAGAVAAWSGNGPMLACGWSRDLTARSPPFPGRKRMAMRRSSAPP